MCGLPRDVSPHIRDNYLIWEEPRGPEFIIELTSPSTANVDRTTKIDLFRDVLKVREYFLFDPREKAQEPRLEGYRLRGGEYRPIRSQAGRLPSQVIGLHLETAGATLRLWNPETETWVPTPAERLAQEMERAENAEERAENAEERLRRLEDQLRAAGIEPQS
jgi:hypothetical protein